MTEFAETAMRSMCRNPRCRSKLPAPVSNPREAFCARGCHTSFYRKRCLVCERPIERKAGNQKVCRKAKCRCAWNARSGFGRYISTHSSSNAKLIAEVPIKSGAAEPLKPGRQLVIVAGELIPTQFHCATVPDGGEYERIEAKNRALLKAAKRAAEEAEIEANGYFTDPEWREVISPDGVKCFVTTFRDGVGAPYIPASPGRP